MGIDPRQLPKWLFYILVITSTLTLATGFPRVLSYLLVLAACTLFFIVTFIYNKPIIRTPRIVIGCFGVLWGIYLCQVIIWPAGGGALFGVGSVLIMSAICTFWIPQVLRLDDALAVIARVSAVIVVLGIPTSIIIPLELHQYSLGPLTVMHAPHAFATFFDWSVRIYPLQSYLRNQNFTSILVLCGTIAALAEFHPVDDVSVKNNRVGWLLLGINAFGVWLTHTRSAMGALVIALSCYVVYRFVGVNAFRGVLVCGGIAAALGGLMVFGIIPGPDALRTLDLSGRRRN